MTGRFITLEGGEGAGKSTQAKRLATALEKHGIKVVTTREPGGSPGAEEIRGLLVNGEPGRWDALTETLLIYAARADHVKRTIGPALLADKWVISDRFTDSTYAYQGAGRGLARETISHLAVTGGIAAGDSIVQQIVGHGVAARLSARLGEGVVNGMLTARVGIAAIEVCRPLPFINGSPPRLADVMAALRPLGAPKDKD